LNALENDEDYESSDYSDEEQPAAKEVVLESSNPIKVFRQKQREFIRPPPKLLPTINIEHIASAETMRTGINASLETSPRQEDTARGSLVQEARPLALTNKSSANFRSSLLN